MTVASELMRPCLVVKEQATVADILDAMQGPVCVVVNSSDRVVGVLTENDLVRLIHESAQFDGETIVAGNIPAFLGMNREQLRAVSVTEIMTADPDTVAPAAPLDELLEIMFDNRRKALLVVEHGRLLGVVYRSDAIKKVLG